MNIGDYPALYMSSDELSLRSQNAFYLFLGLHLAMLVLTAIFSAFGTLSYSLLLLQVVALAIALGCSVYLFSVRPERYWHGGRAVAESVKTITWRYVCRAEPFDGDDMAATAVFQDRLTAIVDQNSAVTKALTEHLDKPQISDEMKRIRGLSLNERRGIYDKFRICEQREWYAKKSKENRLAARRFFWWLIAINVISLALSIVRLFLSSPSIWPTDIFIAAAASLLSWTQAKRFSELASSYAQAASEIGVIAVQLENQNSEPAFSSFVGDAENAFSREHTQWVARRDII